MIRNTRESLGRRLDHLLFTRPLFETLLFENEMGWADRMAVVAHTVSAVVRHRCRHLRLGVGEVVDTFLFGVAFGGRVPRRGMTPVLGLGNLVWHQVADWGVAQRVRRVLGRVQRRNDCTALYCGWRRQVKRGEPLPVFVLLDENSRVLEVVYADVSDNGVEGLSPGVGSDLRPSHPHIVPAIRALASWLEVEDIDDQLLWFTGP